MNRFASACIAFYKNEKERTHAQTSILRPLSYLWCRYQEELCAELRGSTLRTSRRPRRFAAIEGAERKPGSIAIPDMRGWAEPRR